MKKFSTSRIHKLSILLEQKMFKFFFKRNEKRFLDFFQNPVKKFSSQKSKRIMKKKKKKFSNQVTLKKIK